MGYLFLLAFASSYLYTVFSATEEWLPDPPKDNR